MAEHISLVDLFAPDAGPATVQRMDLSAGKQIEVRRSSGEETVTITAADGEPVLTIHLGDDGPVVNITGARLELSSTESVTIESRRVTISAEEQVTVESKGGLDITSVEEMRINSTNDIA